MKNAIGTNKIPTAGTPRAKPSASAGMKNALSAPEYSQAYTWNRGGGWMMIVGFTRSECHSAPPADDR